MAAPLKPLAPNWVENDFTSLAQARGVPGQECRFDDVHTGSASTGFVYGDLYHGRAPDTSATSDPVWLVMRFYRDTDGFFLRERLCATYIAWDDRADPANWP